MFFNTITPLFMRQKAQKRRNIDLKQTNTLHFLPKKLRFLLQENKVPIKKTTILHPKKSKKEAISKSL